jgi:flagellar rod assembly protein/muramidase FlgJ
MGDDSPFPRGAIELALRNQSNIKANAQADQAKAQGNANPNQPTTIVDRIAEAVKQKIQSETSQPRPESVAGIGALPVRDDMFRAAEGGIVSFKEGEEVEGTKKKEPPVPANVQDFVARMYPYANEVSQRTGIPSHVILGQAGLETGWGRNLPRNPDGTTSNNLFGVKPGAGWKGPVAPARTMEEIGGKLTPVNDNFRSYGSPAESMSDWAALMNSPRYAKARGAMYDPAAFGREIKAAGYATDSAYPEKVASTIEMARRGVSSIGPRGNMYRDNDGNLPRPSGDFAGAGNAAPSGIAATQVVEKAPASPSRMDQLLAMQADVKKRYEKAMEDIGQSPAPLTEVERAAMTDREYKRRQELQKPYLEELAKLRTAMAPNRETLAKEAKDRRFDDFFNALGGSRQRGLRGLMGSIGPSAAIAAKPYRESMDKITSLEDAQRKLEYLGQKENLALSQGNYEKADEIAAAMEKAREASIKDIRSQRREAGRSYDTESGGIRQIAMMMRGEGSEAGRNLRQQIANQNRLDVARIRENPRREGVGSRLGDNGEKQYDAVVAKLMQDESPLYPIASRMRKTNPGMSMEDALEQAREEYLERAARSLIGPAPTRAPSSTPAATKPATPSAADWKDWLKQP